MRMWEVCHILCCLTSFITFGDTDRGSHWHGGCRGALQLPSERLSMHMRKNRGCAYLLAMVLLETSESLLCGKFPHFGNHKRQHDAHMASILVIAYMSFFQPLQLLASLRGFCLQLLQPSLHLLLPSDFMQARRATPSCTGPRSFVLHVFEAAIIILTPLSHLEFLQRPQHGHEQTQIRSPSTRRFWPYILCDRRSVFMVES